MILCSPVCCHVTLSVEFGNFPLPKLSMESKKEQEDKVEEGAEARLEVKTQNHTELVPAGPENSTRAETDPGPEREAKSQNHQADRRSVMEAFSGNRNAQSILFI